MQPLPLQSIRPSRLRRRGVWRAVLLFPLMLAMACLMFILGNEGRVAGQVWIHPKGGTKYLATPDANPIAFWVHTTGFMIFGGFIGLLSLLFLWRVFFGPAERRSTVLLQLGAQSMTAHSPRIPGWAALIVILLFIGFLINVAIKWAPAR